MLNSRNKSAGAKTGKLKVDLQSLPWLLPLAFLGVFYFYPLGAILRYSLAEGDQTASALAALSDPYVLRTLWFTIWQAVLSTLLTLLVGLPGAYLIGRYRFRGKALLRALTAIPFIMPTVVVAAGFNALLGGRGWINLGLMRALQLETPPLLIINTLWAILLAHVFYNTTIVIRLVGDFWARLDPRMTQAARTLGATSWRTFTHITVPLLSPAVLTAAMLVFIFNFTSFGVILILGGPRFATLEVAIYRQTLNFFNLPLAALLSLLQLVCTLGLTIAYTRLAARVSQPLSVRSPQITQRRLTKWRTRLAAGVIIVGLLALLVAPLGALAARSTFKLEADRGERGAVTTGFTLNYYRELFINRRQALFFVTPIETIGISLRNALLTVALSLGLGLPAAGMLARRTRFGRWLDPILMLPLGTSAVTLGFGFIIAFNRPPLNLRASPLLLPLAHTLVAFPFVIRSLLPAWTSIRPQLRQAAAVLGSSPSRVWREIDLPLIGRAAIVAAAFAFTISLGEFGATALLSRPEFPTVPVAIYRYLSQPGALNYGQALALSTILMLFCGGGLLAIESLRFGTVGEI
ncbi:MAG: iron ABC transporter permease [Anaerolineales bacterium]|jgi:thiamine transport system permease protein|nr:iron ABC transporter permease [Anaerolineales bacterium]